VVCPSKRLSLNARVGSIVVLVVGALLAACGDDTSQSANDVSTDAGQDTASGDADTPMDAPVDTAADTEPDANPSAFPIQGFNAVWSPCSLHDGEDDGLAECAEVAMPLFWSNPDGRTLTVAAKRLLSKGQAKRQLWLLHGGPGASGVIGYASFMEKMQQYDPEVDLYTLDHRGTGYTRRLGCPDQEDPDSYRGTSIASTEMPACMAYVETEYGDELDALTSTFSAVDLAAYIEATREPDKDVFVYGGSYGTYWAHRYLQVAPEQADGVIIAGIAPPDATFIRFDERANQVGEDFFAVCAADAFCSSKLGTDPWTKLGDVLEAMDQGHCAQLGLPRQYISLLFAYALYYDPINAAVPAVLYRLERCDPQDRAAIAAFFDFQFGQGGVWDINSYSILLQHHVTFSEMWNHPDFEGVDLEQYFLDISDNAYVAKNNGGAKLSLSTTWPAYEDPAYDDGVATTSTPMLMLQGRLDPATSWYDAVVMQDLFHAPNQHFVTFPQSTHGVLSSTPTSTDPDTQHCGMEIFLSFLADPKGALDTSCVEKVLPIDFAGSPTLAEALLGTDDFWENDAAITPTSTSTSSEVVKLRNTIKKGIQQGPNPPTVRIVL
jgi:pimeloyl-ACP methyl ester carboxylesterase